MASDFIWKGQEEARQAIARLQLQAALAENQSRENIAREATQQQRYATQAQINEREKDRQLSREDINARYGARTTAETDRLGRERANIQYSTILDSLNVADPLTKSELEAKLAASQLTDDLKNDLRSRRDTAYKSAMANAAMGDRTAANYQARIDALAKEKFPNAKTRESLFKEISGNKDVLFDAATGKVTSKWRMPREDSTATGAGPLSTGTSPDSSPSRASMLAGAGGGSGLAATPATGVKTLADVRNAAGITGGIGDAEPVQVGAPVTVSDLAPQPRIAPMGFGGGVALPGRVTDVGSRVVPRVSDIAAPQASPIPAPAFLSPMGMISRQMIAQASPDYGNSQLPPTAAKLFESLPYAVPQARMSQPSNAEMAELIGFASHPAFSTLPMDDQQWIRDQINGWQMMNAPRAADLNIRPEYSPVPQDFYQ